MEFQRRRVWDALLPQGLWVLAFVVVLCHVGVVVILCHVLFLLGITLEWATAVPGVLFDILPSPSAFDKSAHELELGILVSPSFCFERLDTATEFQR